MFCFFLTFFKSVKTSTFFGLAKPPPPPSSFTETSKNNGTFGTCGTSL